MHRGCISKPWNQKFSTSTRRMYPRLHQSKIVRLYPMLIWKMSRMVLSLKYVNLSSHLKARGRLFPLLEPPSLCMQHDQHDIQHTQYEKKIGQLQSKRNCYQFPLSHRRVTVSCNLSCQFVLLIVSNYAHVLRGTNSTWVLPVSSSWKLQGIVMMV